VNIFIIEVKNNQSVFEMVGVDERVSEKAWFRCCDEPF
jgi:hypothetical protein